MAFNIKEQKESVGICRGEALWLHLIDFERYKCNSTSINDVRILEHSSSRMCSEWSVTFGDVPFSWVQIDTVNHARREITSEAICGDFTTLRMWWKIHNGSGGNVCISCSLLCEPDPPLIDVCCGDLLRKSFQVMVEELIAAHLHTTEESAMDERRYKRITFDITEIMEINEELIKVRLTDFSCSGMAFRLISGNIQMTNGSAVRLRVNGVVLKGVVFVDSIHGFYRFSFTRPLGERQLKDLFARWSEGRAQPDECIQLYEVVQAPSSTGVRIRSRLHQ